MSDLICEVVTVGNVEKHPDADALSITNVYDFPVIVRSEEFKEGDRAVYFPVDCVVPEHPALEFLWTKSDGDVDPAPSVRQRRIKAKRLRGIFSMGLLIPAHKFREELSRLTDGLNVADALGVTKYVPRAGGGVGAKQPRRDPLNRFEAWKARRFPRWLKRFWSVKYLTEPPWFVKYTDIENVRKYGGALQEGEPLVLTEKIHGSNARYCYHEGRLWIGSRNLMRSQGDDDVWNEVATKYDLEERLKRLPGIIIFGEVYGRTQRGDGYDYGIGDDVRFVLFDSYSIHKGRYLDHEQLYDVVNLLGVDLVPELGITTWEGIDGLLEFASGPTLLGDGNHVREGFVIRPLEERFERRLGRVILKLHGEDFLLGKKLKKTKRKKKRPEGPPKPAAVGS